MSRVIDVVGQSDGSVLRADATGGAGAGVFRAVPGGSGARPLSGACAEQPRPGDAFGS
ncbi:hypothetical protein ACFFUA_19735 [Streptomyces heliomycini]|uniref:Uncharacterized protein n=1 Tax=Streptomyces heliomycini TaxID=284032 RepID=A0ABV5LCQ2_9ACTN